MTKTLERNAEVVLVVEVSAVLLKKAGTSATEFVAHLRELALIGWELHEHRFFPLLAPGNYEYMDEHWTKCRAFSQSGLIVLVPQGLVLTPSRVRVGHSDVWKWAR